jgi:acyl-CoA thioester hydrolase
MDLPLYHDHRFRVRYAETDQMGVVHHAVYPVWFEAGRTEYSYAREFPYSKIEAAGFAMAVADMEVRYKRPARYDQTVTVRTWVSRRRPKLVRFDYQVLDEAGEILALGHTVHIMIDKESFRPKPMPPEMAQHFPIWNPEG